MIVRTHLVLTGVNVSTKSVDFRVAVCQDSSDLGIVISDIRENLCAILKFLKMCLKPVLFTMSS